MKRRRSLSREEQVTTLHDFLARKRWSQVAFIGFMAEKGITISAQHLNDVLRGRKNPGPAFKQIFREITGVALVDGLIEEKETTHV